MGKTLLTLCIFIDFLFALPAEANVQILKCSNLFGEELSQSQINVLRYTKMLESPNLDSKLRLKIQENLANAIRHHQGLVDDHNWNSLMSNLERLKKIKEENEDKLLTELQSGEIAPSDSEVGHDVANVLSAPLYRMYGQLKRDNNYDFLNKETEILSYGNVKLKIHWLEPNNLQDLIRALEQIDSVPAPKETIKFRMAGLYEVTKWLNSENYPKPRPAIDKNVLEDLCEILMYSSRDIFIDGRTPLSRIATRPNPLDMVINAILSNELPISGYEKYRLLGSILFGVHEQDFIFYPEYFARLGEVWTSVRKKTWFGTYSSIYDKEILQKIDLAKKNLK